MRQLAGDSEIGTDADRSASPLPPFARLAGGGLDDLLPVRRQYAVLPADASQLRAIEAARSGSDLVIHGPPGTGKSQTIANIIATLLAERKKVPFVSGKTAALDIVKRRLEECDLGVFCLDLHSERGKKSSVYDQLRKSFDARRQDRGGRFDFEKLSERRNKLNQVVRALHEVRNPLGKSIYEVQGEYALLQEYPRVDFPVDGIASPEATSHERIVASEEPARPAGRGIGALQEAQRDRISATAERVARRPQEFREHNTSIWRALRVAATSVQLGDRIRDDMELLTEAIDQADLVASRAARRYETLPAGCAADFESAATLAAHLAAAPGVLKGWLGAGVPERLRPLVRDRRSMQSRYRELERDLAAALTAIPADLDHRAMRSTATLPQTERTAIAALFGAETDQRLGREPQDLVREAEACARAAGVLDERTGQAAALVGAPRPATLGDVDALLERLEQIGAIAPVPASWVDPHRQTALTSAIDDAAEAAANLQQQEDQIRERFVDGIVDVVDEALLRRFRLDYLSFWRRIGRSHRQDERLLKGYMHQAGKLSREAAVDAIELALAIGRARSEWDAGAAHRDELFGDRPHGRATDWAALRSDLDAVTDLVSTPDHDLDELQRALTAPAASASIRRHLEDLRLAHRQLGENLPGGFEREQVSLLHLDQIHASATAAIGPSQAVAAATAALRSALREPVANIGALLDLIDDLITFEDLQADEVQARTNLSADFGERYRGLGTDWDDVEAAVSWTSRLLELAPRPLSPAVRAFATDPAAPDQHSQAALELRAAHKAFVAGGARLAERFDHAGSAWDSWDAAPFAALREWAAAVHDAADRAGAWVEYRAAARDLRDLLGADVIGQIREVTDDATLVPKVILRRLLAAWLDHQYQGVPAIKDFTGRDHDALVREFAQLDRSFPSAARGRVAEACFATYPDPSSLGRHQGEIGTLTSELSKRRRQLPVRRLFARIPTVLQALKPCILISPLAVSQYLPRGELASETLTFDTVIFDEASQVFPEDAVPAIARAKQLIVVGDQKQLPPTAFFRRAIADDLDTDDDADPDDTDALEGRESILDVMVGMAGRGIAQEHLNVHYRSRHESLIRFSNHHFYEDRLLTFPAPQPAFKGLGIEDVYLPDGRYDAGASRTNRLEATAVVDRVVALMRSHPSRESIGVVTLNRPQAELIQALIDERRLGAPDLDERFRQDIYEPFFVKNLENVQGDERDHMILSIGYGPTVASGAVHNRFGPLNKEGGERRLNVAITRARRSMTVVRSLRPSDITSTQTGAQLLRRYLEYLGDPVGAFERQTSADPAAEFESDFERAVAYALEGRGHVVDRQVGVSGYRIDLAVRSVDDERYDLGIECDGWTYHSAPAARDRDWLRQSVLEGLGWRIHRVWSTAWVRNPQREVELIEEALAEARAAASPSAPLTPPDGPEATPPPGPAAPDISPGDSPDLAEDRASAGQGPPVRPFDLDVPRDPQDPADDPELVGAGMPPRAAPADPLFAPYECAELADIRVGPELQFEVQRTMHDLLRRIVEVEGAVHRDVILERLRQRYGLRHAGRLIRERVDRALRDALRTQVIAAQERRGEDGSFFIPLTGDFSVVPRRPITAKERRRIEHVSLAEQRAGVLRVVDALYGCARHDLIKATAREFGYLRTGGIIEERIGGAIQTLLDDRILRESLGNLTKI